MYNNNNYKKLQERADIDELDEDQGFLSDSNKEAEDQEDPNTFIDQYIRYIDKYLHQLFPKTQDAKTADAILELFRKRDSLEVFNKKALYIYIREMIDAKTPKITKIADKLYIIYKQGYLFYLENGYIKFQ